MITNFKLFESITIKPRSTYIIYGDIDNIINILKKIKSNLIKIDAMSKNIEEINKTIQRLYNEVISGSYLGVILFCSRFGLSYKIISDDKEEIINMINDSDYYIFKGELKIENDEVVLDTIEVDTKKYNL